MREPNVAIYMLRCVQLGLSLEMLAFLSMGDVYDMLTEQGNDQYEYPIKATQEHINAFFG